LHLQLLCISPKKFNGKIIRTVMKIKMMYNDCF